jgi:formylmethanofuran dehydrogenase subunit E
MGKSVPSKVPKTKDVTLGTFRVIMDWIEEAGGKEVYYCNSCNKQIIFDKNSTPPITCRKCGEEFLWGDLQKKKIKICPSCNRDYDLEDVYCEDHVPAVKLQQGLR